MFSKGRINVCRAKTGRTQPSYFGDMFPYLAQTESERLVDGRLLEAAAHQKAQEEEQKIAFEQAAEEAKLAEKRRKELLKKQQEEQKMKDDIDKHTPKEMTIDSVPADHILQPPVQEKEVKQMQIQRETPLGTKRVYYTEIIPNK
jgi:hypothetical protein